MMRVLHITYWYPNVNNPKEALWVRNHVQSLSQYASQEVIHLNISPAKKGFIKVVKSEDANHFLIGMPIKSWWFSELLSFFSLLFILLVKRVNQKFDMINFHISYPNLTYWHLIKRWVKIPIVITEHWSAYHFGFNMTTEPTRIQKIFQQNIPLIAVSKALITDIRKFSNAAFPSFVVPNIVNTSIFYFDESIKPEKNRFFMVSQWKDPKDPFSVLRAFAHLIQEGPSVLIIGGYGPQMENIEKMIHELDIGESVELLGPMNPTEIAVEMNKASAFIHISEYETFSVVCAEAICCGCPVIANKVGGIPEFIDDQNGMLLNQNKDLLLDYMRSAQQRPQFFDSYKIALLAKMRFDSKGIGEKYYHVLQTIVGL